MEGKNPDQNPKQLLGKPTLAKVKDFLRDRDRDNPDGEEIQRGILQETRREITHRRHLEDNLDEEELGGRRNQHQPGSQIQIPHPPPRPHIPANNLDLSVRVGRDHGHRQLTFADDTSVDLEERSSHERRRLRRSSVGTAEQYQRWKWLMECRDGLISFFIEPFQSGRHSRHGRKWYNYSKDELRQQKLPVLWEPIWNCRSVGRLLLYLSVLTIPLAAVLFLTNAQTRELRFTFGEECKNARNYLRLIRSMCTFCGGNLNPNCQKAIEITEDIKLPVYLYYELEGFHQNHRKLTRAMDSDQLMGKIFDSNMKPVTPENCGEYTKDKNGKIYFPCGALANLMFNDDFALITPSGEEVELRVHGVAWSGLKYHRFKNPPSDVVNQKDYHLKSKFKDHFVKPKDWTTEMWDDWWSLGANENERFINWMNPSAFSHMRKLYAIIDSVPMCPIGILCKGNYTMKIEYRYDVDRFEGNKAFILATTSWFGGRNLVLPYVVGVIGGLEFALGLLMIQLHRRYGNLDHCIFSKAEISTIEPSRSRSRSSRYSSRYRQPTQQHLTSTDNPQLHAPQHRSDGQDDNKPVITTFKRTSDTPVKQPAQQNPNLNDPPTVKADQSFDTILDMNNVTNVAVASSTVVNNPPTSSTAEGRIVKRQPLPLPEVHQQRRNDGRGGGVQDISLLYQNQNPSSFPRDSLYTVYDNSHQSHEEFFSIQEVPSNNNDTEDEGSLTTNTSSVVSDAESFLSYWSNDTMITAAESSSEAEEGGGAIREGMMIGGSGSGTNDSVPRKRRLQ